MTSRRMIAVVGAGIAGLTAARHLRAAGHAVRLFDKGRSVGGRVSVRREGEWAFDHGAQYFTARDPRFLKQTKMWTDSGVAARWESRLVEMGDGFVTLKHDSTERFVGVNAMNAIAKDLVTGLETVTQSRIVRIERTTDGWTLWREDGADAGTFTDALIAVPAPQAVALLAAAPSLSESAASVAMEPCWSVMASFDGSFPLPFDAGFPVGNALAWIASNSSKPGRTDSHCWVLQASHGWSRENEEANPEEVTRHLLASFFQAISERPSTPLFVRAHRWRFAIAPQPLRTGCLWDPGLRMGACGDWCEDGRIEGAYLSGLALAERVLGDA